MEHSRTHKKQKWILLSLLGIISLFALLQFTHQPLERKPVTSPIEAPENVVAILERSCYDCHSNQTDLEWFDKIAPVSWEVNKNVARAREVLNFSEWEGISEGAHLGKMWAILNMLKADKMPLKSYRLLHKEAKVTDADVEVIEDYVLSLTHQKSAKPSPTISFKHPSANRPEKNKFPQSPNGVRYTDEFKNWKVISSSTMFDRSMRVIYGNDLAAKAIEEEDFFPWPDGAIVVKAAWEQVENQYGEIRTGDFINAQFMVKDAEKFKDTEGWGFAKFSTDELVPTGKNALFAAQSCIGCHRQLAEGTGYLFSVPLKVNLKSKLK